MSEVRRYTSLDGFAELVRGVKDVSSIDTSQLVVVSKMPTEVKALGGEDSRMIDFTITTNRVDRDQDTIASDGWDFKDYEKNPVVLWCHDHYAPVIGNSRSLTVRDGQVSSICEFTPQDLNPFGYMIYRLYEKRFMHAVSVGFIPTEFTMAADRKYGVNYVKQGMLEYSTVPVPSNPDALRRARSKGIDITPLKDWAERALDEKSGLSDDARRQMEILRAVSAPTGRALILDLGDFKMAEPEKPAAPTSAVKRIDRWECGIDGHAHTNEAEAKSCSEFETHVTDVTRSLQGLQALVKSGKTIKPEAGALLRSVVDELVPPAKAAEETTTEEPALTTEEPMTIEVDEEKLLAAITDGVTAAINEKTGRVD